MDPIAVRVITMPFVPALGGFDPAPMEALARQAQILEAVPAFFEYGGLPHWSLVVTCRLRPVAGESENAGKRSGGAQSSSVGPGRPNVADADMGLFQALRAWRAETADQRGVPAYMILTNRQLTDIARLKPPSLASLGTVPGIGPGRLQKHGKAILEVIGRGGPPVTGQATPGPIPATSAAENGHV